MLNAHLYVAPFIDPHLLRGHGHPIRTTGGVENTLVLSHTHTLTHTPTPTPPHTHTNKTTTTTTAMTQETMQVWNRHGLLEVRT